MGMRFRQDIKFQFDHTGLGEYPIRYTLNTYVVRIEKSILGGDNEIRYGIMLDMNSEDTLYDACYVIDIPTNETLPGRVKEAQEKIIRDFIDEKRRDWQQHLAKAKGMDGSSITCDEWDKIQRIYNSVDGKWNILKNFCNSKLNNNSFFLNVFMPHRNITSKDIQDYFLECRIPFQTGENYYISVDWLVPYICFEENYRVSHLRTDMPSSNHFYPFHNFYWQDIDITTQITIRENEKYGEENESYSIKVNPTNYSLLSYFYYIINRIEKIKNDNYEALKPYYQYIQNLSMIQSILINKGPLKDLTEQEINNLSMEGYEDWNGNITNRNYNVHLSYGLIDIMESSALFSNIIKLESENGRNGNSTAQIDSDVYALMNSFFSNISKKYYEDLWAFNQDLFGIDLFLNKILLLISQSRYAEDFYNRHLKSKLYEHPFLEDEAKGDKSDNTLVPEWENILYRSTNIAINTWQIFYIFREKALNGRVDRSIKKLVNYILGGNAMADILQSERTINVEIEIIIRSIGNSSEIPANKLRQLNSMGSRIRRSLLGKAGLTPDIPSTKGLMVVAAINMLISTTAFNNAYKSEGTTEMKLRAFTIALGAVSDIGNAAAARFLGVSATLSRKALAKITSIAARRVALSLGCVEAVAGSVGGILGFLWCSYDAITSYSNGYRKDAVLDGISAIGCAIATVGLFLDGSIVGLPIGVVCNVVGFVIVIVAQIIKAFRLHTSETEDFCRDLYNKPIDENGMDRMRFWFDELENHSVYTPWQKISEEEQEKMTKRLDKFLVDWDVFDEIEPNLSSN